MIKTRDQIKEEFNLLEPTLGDDGSPLWVLESPTKKSEWFIEIPSIIHYFTTHQGTKGFHEWNKKNLKGHVLCYMVNDETDLWGFSEYDDIAWFLLKWL